jgi:hypothetical protein
VAVRIATSSKWLMGDPLYEPKARGINELPMRFDPERASVWCRAAMHALEPGNQCGGSEVRIIVGRLVRDADF